MNSIKRNIQENNTQENEDIISTNMISSTVTREQKYYNGIGLGSNKIDTILLSGGGYYGIGYIGLFRFLEDAGIRNDIKHVYGVSAGALLGLIFALGITSAKARHMVLHEINMGQLIEIKARHFLNLPDRLGMNDGQYIVDTCKRILREYGFSEYCTFQELYDKTGIDLHLGVMLVFNNEYQIWNRQSRPDMPLWQAIRGSSAIPFIFMPITDYVSCDLICDGGLLHSNPIGYYLRNRGKTTVKTYNTNCGKSRSIGCQAGGEFDGNIYLDTCNSTNSEETNIEKIKYCQNFWGLELDIRRYKTPQTQTDLDQVAFMDFISAVLYKIFSNQDGHRQKFRQLLQVIKCAKYNLSFVNLELTPDLFDTIERDFYKQCHDYYYNYLLLEK